MRDFTSGTYRKLLIEFIQAGYTFQTYREYLIKPAQRTIILLHPVGMHKKHVLLFAHIEHVLGLSATYFFRAAPKYTDPVVLSLVKKLNHEIGYAYADMTVARGNQKKAMLLFCRHLESLRQYYPVKTIKKWNAPFSAYDQHTLWKFNKYTSFGINGDADRDVNSENVLRISDAGRKWQYDNKGTDLKNSLAGKIKFQSTKDVTQKISEFPDTVMLTIHPDLWIDTFLPWVGKLVFMRLVNFSRWIFRKRFTKNSSQQG